MIYTDIHKSLDILFKFEGFPEKEGMYFLGDLDECLAFLPTSQQLCNILNVPKFYHIGCHQQLKLNYNIDMRLMQFLLESWSGNILALKRWHGCINDTKRQNERHTLANVLANEVFFT